METFNSAVFRAHGLPENFAQDNHSYSKRGVVRGLHYQLVEPQGKLVRCTRGAILDVAVDIRRGSPHFGKWNVAELTADNRPMLWVPHGFSVLSDDAKVLYKCTTLWHRESDRSILWNDPDLAIDWRVDNPSVSPKTPPASSSAKPASSSIDRGGGGSYDAPPSGECASSPLG
jgi:dTDP-4-dehydrorhamnose 3,5-epimerase